MKTVEQQNQATYSIGVAARMTGISAHKLRMWERRYELSSSKRSAGGQREFTTTDIDHLRLIKRLTDSGMRIGDIANLPMKTLSTLVHDSQTDPIDPDKPRTFTATVCGLTLGNHFRKHAKRFPRVIFSILEQSADEFFADLPPIESDLLILQVDVLTAEQASDIQKVANTNTHVIVFYHYAAKASKAILSGGNVTLTSGAATDQQQIDDAVAKALMIQQHVENLNESARALHLTLPTTKQRLFDEESLIDASQKANKLNCECPTHLSDLIQRLNAFEEYSRNCETESWQEAAIHACIYTYTNQARHLMEKALQAVLEEQG